MEQRKRKELSIKKKGLTTEKTFAIWIIGLFIGFVWATFFKDAPFDALATALTGGLLGITGKRLFMRHRRFNEQDMEVHED